MISATPIFPSRPSSSTSVLRGLRIGFVAGTLGQGGAERQLFYILKSLVEFGAEVNLLSLTSGEHWEAPIRELGVPIYFVGSVRSRMIRLWRVLKVMRRLRPQVVQCQHFYTGIYGGTASRCLGIPSVGAVRSDGINELKSTGRLMGRLCIALPHWMAANSRRAMTNLSSVGLNCEKFLLLPNVVDTEQFSPHAKGRAEDEFVILGVGSLKPVKRFDRFLEIAERLSADTVRTVHVIIAGGGPQLKQIETLAAQARRKGVKVELLGAVTDPAKLYASADVFLLTSDYEGTPNVVMEAMACQLPIVATNVGGVEGLIQNDQTGFLFEPDDGSTALAGLKQLAADPVLAAKFGRNARGFIVKHHSTNLLPEILAGLYSRILAA